MRYTFEWDPNKAKPNVQNHKVSFERAAEVFLDPLAVSIFDEKHSDEEERWITLGKDRREVVLVIVHTFREVGGLPSGLFGLSLHGRQRQKKLSSMRNYDERRARFF